MAGLKVAEERDGSFTLQGLDFGTLAILSAVLDEATRLYAKVPPSELSDLEAWAGKALASMDSCVDQYLASRWAGACPRG
jgi:hypothetical protein